LSSEAGYTVLRELFTKVLTEMRGLLDQGEYDRWLKPLSVESASENQLVIKAPNIYFEAWIRDHYLADFSRISKKIYGNNIQIQFSSASRPFTDGDGSPDTKKLAGGSASVLTNYTFGLNKKYTFSNFLVGTSNELAYVASREVSRNRGTFNPLYIFGGSGLGKTHLLNAIGNQLIKQNNLCKIACLNCENFTNELTEAFRCDQVDKFHKKYRSIDVLLIDDINFIGGKKTAQEEFFYTFNSLYESGRQIVITSNKTPKQITDLEDRLVSRFEGGLFADIGPPDQPLKKAILEKIVHDENINLNEEFIDYLSSLPENNIRTLEGYLTRLGAYASLNNNSLTLDKVKGLLRQFTQTENEKIGVDRIMKITCGFFNVTVDDIKSKNKNQAVAVPRQAAMYLMRRHTPLSTTEIGRLLGNRDHSTVVHANRKVQAWLKDNKDFSMIMYEIEQALLAGSGERQSDGS